MPPSDDNIFLGRNHNFIQNVLANPKDCEISIFIEGENSEAEEVDNIKVTFFQEFVFSSRFDRSYHIEYSESSLQKSILNLDYYENSLGFYRCFSDQTVLITSSHGSDFISIALVENPFPVLFSKDLFCEDLSFPQLISIGKFGFQVKQSVTFSNQVFPFGLFYKSFLKDSSDSDYIFFLLRVLQSSSLHCEINIAMKKIALNNLTAGMLSTNFMEETKKFIASELQLNWATCSVTGFRAKNLFKAMLWMTSVI